MQRIDCYKEFIWNPSNRECEYEKSCDVRKYLDYENCKCRKKLVDKLNKECTENVDEWLYLSIEMSVYVLTQFMLSWL